MVISILGIVQIQHLLKLNEIILAMQLRNAGSNTTLVKVKLYLKNTILQVLFRSNTTLVKVKFIIKFVASAIVASSNTTLVKVKYRRFGGKDKKSRVQIQHLLKLNIVAVLGGVCLLSSNTTLVKVKLMYD